MKDYLIFIDTETSGLPKKWDSPYSNLDNWPFAIQIAWIIFDKDGKEIKRENHYIFEEEFTIDKSSQKIHGITLDFLREYGIKRKPVLRKLAYDIKKYNPLIIGHFIELDLHILNVDFKRAGLKHFIAKSNLFCTMLNSRKYAKNPQYRFLPLSALYKYLFGEDPNNMHNALTDAEVTAKCFFELVKQGEIDEEDITQQQAYFIEHIKQL